MGRSRKTVDKNSNPMGRSREEMARHRKRPRAYELRMRKTNARKGAQKGTTFTDNPGSRTPAKANLMKSGIGTSR